MRILIVRMGSLGDIIHTLPAAATLKAAFPAAELDWVVERHWLPLVERNPHLSQIHCVETRRWRRELAGAGTWRSLAGTLGTLRRRRYDCALDFQGLIKSAVLARLSGAAELVGFDRAEAREKWSSVFYTRRVGVPTNGRCTHVVERNLALAAAVGAVSPVVEFGCAPAPDELVRVRSSTPGPRKYVVLSPAAGWSAKRWPAESFAALARRITCELGLPVVLNCGPGEEVLVDRVAALAAASLRAPEARPAVARLSLPALTALVYDAALLVAGDTGPLHLAAACGTPVVGVFGPTDPARNGPLGAPCRVLRAPQAPTTYSRSAGPEAIQSVSVEQVFEAARELLRGA